VIRQKSFLAPQIEITHPLLEGIGLPSMKNDLLDVFQNCSIFCGDFSYSLAGCLVPSEKMLHSENQHVGFPPPTHADKRPNFRESVQF